MYRRIIPFLFCLFFLLACDVPAWIRFDNKTNMNVYVRYYHGGDSLVDFYVFPKSKKYIMLGFGDNWSAESLKRYFNKEIILEICYNNDTITYSDKKELYKLFKENRTIIKKGIVIKIK